jgi:hypothetical protein
VISLLALQVDAEARLATVQAPSIEQSGLLVAKADATVPDVRGHRAGHSVLGFWLTGKLESIGFGAIGKSTESM